MIAVGKVLRHTRDPDRRPWTVHAIGTDPHPEAGARTWATAWMATLTELYTLHEETTTP